MQSRFLSGGQVICSNEVTWLTSTAAAKHTTDDLAIGWNKIFHFLCSDWKLYIFYRVVLRISLMISLVYVATILVPIYCTCPSWKWEYKYELLTKLQFPRQTLNCHCPSWLTRYEKHHHTGNSAILFILILNFRNCFNPYDVILPRIFLYTHA